MPRENLSDRPGRRLADELCGELDKLAEAADLVASPGSGAVLVHLERTAAVCAQVIAATRTADTTELAGPAQQLGLVLSDVAARWAGVDAVDGPGVLYLASDVMDVLDRAQEARRLLDRSPRNGTTTSIAC
jgi:hypothetical protein